MAVGDRRMRRLLAGAVVAAVMILAGCDARPPYPPDVASCTLTKVGWDCTLLDGSGGGGGGGGGGGW